MSGNPHHLRSSTARPTAAELNDGSRGSQHGSEGSADAQPTDGTLQQILALMLQQNAQAAAAAAAREQDLFRREEERRAQDEDRAQRRLQERDAETARKAAFDLAKGSLLKFKGRASGSTVSEVEEFLRSVERVADAARMTDEGFVNLVSAYLSENARTWFQGLAEPPRTHAAFVELFRAQFLPKDLLAVAKRALSEARMTSTIADFHSRFQTHVNDLRAISEGRSVSDKELLDWYLDGLRSHGCAPRAKHVYFAVSAALLANEDVKLRQAMAFAERYDRYFPETAKAKVTEPERERKRSVEVTQAEPRRYKRPREPKDAAAGHVLPASLDTPKEQVQCFRCKQFGHRIKDCRLPPSDNKRIEVNMATLDRLYHEGLDSSGSDASDSGEDFYKQK